MGLPTINKLLTPYNYSNYNTSRIKYIVIHYVGALGGAKANCQYYAGQYVGASAHYYVGFQGEIWQSVEDKNIAWAVGATSYVHSSARNNNTLHIEMCVRKKSTSSMGATDKDWYFESATVTATIELTKYLMDKYNVPISNVIRHYDVTGKVCPNPFVYNHTSYTWTAFKNSLSVPSIKVGGKYTLLVNIPWRTAPSGNYIRWKNLKTESGKKKSTKRMKSRMKKGNTVQALEVKTQANGNIWVRVKNGWLCVVYKGKHRIKEK